MSSKCIAICNDGKLGSPEWVDINKCAGTVRAKTDTNYY